MCLEKQANKRINPFFFGVLTFAKCECDNVLQHKPQGSCCNTLSHSDLANANMEKNVISSLLYTYLSSTLGLNGNEALCCHVLMGMKPKDLSTISRIATR